jgi:NADH-quinone oxidoreductase subunit M
MNLLLFAVLAPVLGALVVSLVPNIFTRLQNVAALVASALGLLAIARVAAKFSSTDATMQFAIKYTFTAEAGIDFYLGVDGISLGFLLISALMCFVTLLVRGRPSPTVGFQFQQTCIAMLLVQAALAGLFSARDLIVLWCFWALFVLSAFLLVGLSGGSRRLLASSKVALSGFASLVLLLGLFLYLGGQAHVLGGRFDFDLEVMTRILMPLSSQYVALSVALVALALSLPLVPLSGWWNDTHSQSSALACSVMFLSPALYVLIRIVVPCFPLAAFNLLPLVAGLCLAGSAIAAVASYFEDDLRRRIAWVGCVQISIAVVGLSSFNAQGVMGALLISAVSALSLGGLMLCLNQHPSEASSPTPHDAEFVTFLPKAFALSSALLPGLGGFAAAFTAMAGVAAADRTNETAGMPRSTFDIEPLWLVIGCVFCSLAVGASVVSALRGSAGVARTLRLGLRAVPVWALFALLLILGLRPQLWYSLVEASTNQYVVEMQKKVLHSSAAPEAPTHLFPNARSMLVSSLVPKP